MPLLGAHMSIAGGLHLAFARLREVKGEALQIFLRNERRWHTPPLNPEAVATFRRAHEESGRLPLAAHDSYLINLAAPDAVVRDRSTDAFAGELRRGEALGIAFLITHPGSHLGQGVEARPPRAMENRVSNRNTRRAVTDKSIYRSIDLSIYFWWARVRGFWRHLVRSD